MGQRGKLALHFRLLPLQVGRLGGECRLVDRAGQHHRPFAQQVTGVVALGEIHADCLQVVGDGLVFQFTNTTDLALKRRACSRVTGELNMLAERLAHEIALGVRVDWNRLAVLDVPGEARQLVTLNGDDEGLMLPLRALAVAPELFRLLRPWLAARVDGNSYRLVLLNSEQLMAGLIQTGN